LFQPRRPVAIDGIVAELQGVVLVADALATGQSARQPVGLMQGMPGAARASRGVQPEQLGKARSGAVGSALRRSQGGDLARLREGARIVVHQRGSEGCTRGVAAQQGGRGAVDGDGLNLAESPLRGQPVEILAQRRPPDLRVLLKSAVDLNGGGQGR
jgi:hypothetical protein